MAGCTADNKYKTCLQTFRLTSQTSLWCLTNPFSSPNSLRWPHRALPVLGLIPPSSRSELRLHSATKSRWRPKRKSCSTQADLYEVARGSSDILIYISCLSASFLSHRRQSELTTCFAGANMTGVSNKLRERERVLRLSNALFFDLRANWQKGEEKRNGRETKDGTPQPWRSLIYTFPCCSISRDIFLTEAGDPSLCHQSLSSCSRAWRRALRLKW